MGDENVIARVSGKEAMVDDLVQVMVPRRFLVDVYALIAKLQAKEGFGEQSREGEESEGWTPETVRRFYERSAPNMVRALNHLAKNAGEWVPGSELAEAIAPGGGRNPLPGTFSGASRHAKKGFGLSVTRAADEKNAFLIDKAWGHVQGRPHTAAYRLDSKYAEQIRSYMREV